MVKTLKIFFSGTGSPITLNVGMQHRVLKYYQVCSNDVPGLTMTLWFLYGKKVKQWIFSEIILVSDIKVGRFSQLDLYMNLYEYQRSRSFIDLGPNLSD